MKKKKKVGKAAKKVKRFLSEHADDIAVGIGTGIVTNIVTDAFNRAKKKVSAGAKEGEEKD